MSLLALATAVGLIVSLPSHARAQAPVSKWQAAIDATWGEGLPTDRKLEIFDRFWRTIDERFAAFQGVDVDWAALRERYRPEVAAGVSRGRFAAIMNQLALALHESHTTTTDPAVANTPRLPGEPIWAVGNRVFSNFGACATALEDGSSLIYQVTPGHPLGVEPGDRILGYEGRPWRELYRELLAAELPFSAGSGWGSSPASLEHSLVLSAASNWHLFETIDILKHDSGTVEHFSTAPLNTTPPLRAQYCREQLAVPGVPRPVAVSDLVTWGVVEGTRIGYVYVTAWTGDAGDRFEQAIRELTVERATDGLIIDFRVNRGGNMFLSDAGLGMLFDRPMPTIGFALRADPNDHYRMRLEVGRDAETFEICGVPWQGAPPSLYVIDMCDRSYDPRSYRPIAVLTGPGAVSSGDQVALRMTFHPHARIFGKTTATAFNSPCDLELEPGWSARYACGDACRIDNPHDYLTHDDLPVDEPVWLRPDDVAQGKDTVVEAAIDWINGQTP